MSDRGKNQEQDWLDDAFKEFQKYGGMDNNPYKGKPIPIPTERGGEEAALYSVLKNANVLPPWLNLQKEIRDQIKSLIDRLPTLTGIQIDEELIQINNKVKKYNNTCPPAFQKMRIIKETIEKQYEKWC